MPSAAEEQPRPAPGLGLTAARGLGVSLSAQLVRFVLQIVGLAVLSRVLSPAEVGLVALVTSVLNVAEVIRDFGLSSAAISAPSLTRQQRDNLFWLNLGFGAVCSVLAAGLAPVLAWAYDRPELTPIALVLSCIFVISGANTQYRADLSRQLRFRALATTDVLSLAVAVGAAIASAALGAGPWAIVVQQVALAVCSLIINVVQCRWRARRYDRATPIRSFLRFGSHLLGTNLLGYAVNNVDNIGVGAVWGPSALGLYNRSYQLLQQPLQQLTAPLSRVALPVLSRVRQVGDYLVLLRRFQLAIAYPVGLAFVVLAGASRPSADLLLGPQWSGTAPLLAVLAVSGVFRALDAVSYQIWVSRDVTGPLFRFYLVSRPVMIGIVLAGLPWGPIGVAWGHLVAALLHWLVSTRIACHYGKLPYGPVVRTPVIVLTVVLLPAGLLTWLVGRLLPGDVLPLAVGAAVAVAWAALSSVATPSLRRDLVLVVSTVRRGGDTRSPGRRSPR